MLFTCRKTYFMAPKTNERTKKIKNKFESTSF